MSRLRLHSSEQFSHSQSEILHNATYNKGTAFTKAERTKLKLHGLLPYAEESLEQQHERALHQLRSQADDLAKHVYLQVLRNRNETLFFNLVINNFEECAPLVYTPTVGLACQRFSIIHRDMMGMFLTKYDKGDIRSILNNWPHRHVDIIVVTDGSRILGLGDLGANGMGIPIGKLVLYTAAAGFHPATTLPITIDVGCDNEKMTNDKRYLGVREKRTMSDEEYYAFMDEFMAAIYDKWPKVLVQFEDFSNNHCFDLLERYQQKYCCFNDDIQGTGAVIASGILNAWRAANTDPSKSKFVFFGAGSAATGVANQIVDVLVEKGVSEEDARKQFYFVDSKGLVAVNRGDTLADHKLPYARSDVDAEQLKNLTTILDVVNFVKPTALLGLSGQGGSFGDDVLRAMASFNAKPIIFALSNPTANSECTAEQAYKASDGRAVFASGSPFDPVELNGRVLRPGQVRQAAAVVSAHVFGQGNNMYIFPGLGFGASLCQAQHVTRGMIAASVQALADYVTEEQLADGLLYPPLSTVRDVSKTIALAVIKRAIAENECGAKFDTSQNLEELVALTAYEGKYATTAKL